MVLEWREDMFEITVPQSGFQKPNQTKSPSNIIVKWPFKNTAVEKMGLHLGKLPTFDLRGYEILINFSFLTCKI